VRKAWKFNERLDFGSSEAYFEAVFFFSVDGFLPREFFELMKSAYVETKRTIRTTDRANQMILVQIERISP